MRVKGATMKERKRELPLCILLAVGYIATYLLTIWIIFRPF